MAKPFQNLAQQLYLGIAPIGIGGIFLVHGLRKNEKYSSLYIWRSSEQVPDSLVDAFDTEFTEMVAKEKKKFKDAKFSVSLIDNLEARTYGSFRIVPGVEFQVPVISTVNDVKTIRSKYSNLLDLIKELGLKGSIDTDLISDDKLKRILLSDPARQFFLRREIIQGESLSHMVVPIGVGSACIFLGYPVFKVFAFGMGPWIALLVTGSVAIFSAYHLLQTEAKQRILAMDRRIIEADKSLITGAKEYLKARIAFCRLAYEFGDEQTRKGFDAQGNCQEQQASYVERLKEIVDFEEKEKQKEQAMFFRQFSTRKKKQQVSFKEQADIWIRSQWGRRFRIGLLAGTVVIYPIYHLVTNGPLLKYMFYRKHEIDTDLPSHLKTIIEEEYLKFCEREARPPKDAPVYFGVQKGLEDVDSIARGSLGVRFGAHIALPFYTRFTSQEEALNYCQKHLTELRLFGKRIPINWDTPTGQELLETFLLPSSALRFLVMRDMYANDGYNAFANRAISWATWTSFTSIFTYWFHQRTRTCNGTALSFVIVYGIFLLLATFAHDQWFLLYRFLADTHGDSVASRITMDYSTGGKEYYWNILKRNRILRDFIPNGYEYITPVGDFRDVTTKLIVRYDLLKDVGIEDDEIRPVVEVFFGSMFVPIRKYSTGDGIFVQWVMCSAILIVGIIVNALKDFPQFQPLAMVGGFFWAVGNLTAVPIINLIGLGMGLLVWGTVNCVVGWACGRFGLFGTNATVPSSPVINYLGLILVVTGGFLFSRIRPSVGSSDSNSNLERENEAENARLIPDEDEINNRDGTETETFSRKTRRSLGIGLSLLAGLFYGVTFVPVVYIQDHKEDFRNPPDEAIAYAFSQYCGIYATSTAALIIYLAYTRNRPFLNPETILPSFLTGLLWAVAQLSWFVANDALSQAITFPIISTVPGVISSFWGVLYFKEIEGRQNLRILGIAIASTITGATLVGLSKGTAK